MDAIYQDLWTFQWSWYGFS